MANDTLKTLKEEHDPLSRWFEELNATTERAERGCTELLRKIKASLLPHALWEEEFFYPEFKNRANRDGLQAFAEAVQEHRAVELRVLPDLEAASPTSTEFTGRAKVLSEFVEHHAKEEEKTMFAMARKLFSAEERADFDDHYADWKSSSEAKKALAKAAEKASAALRTNPPAAQMHLAVRPVTNSHHRASIFCLLPDASQMRSDKGISKTRLL